ncbi:IST1 family protein [Sphingopyxis sp. 113P3]|uniref:IST1 family protein n=1 Tax=Sphingopyxis sp. (strain 113P3) TaxID=292913 RepID=UPI0006BC8C93|nr:IST1 family protein [Sphingopyxis sp. 113P3]ALC13804.1 hypothetical protein LH20_17745 [Sphingopyxis sp. 113P3]
MGTTPQEGTRRSDADQMRAVLEFCDQFRETVMARFPEFEDPREAFNMAMVAGVMFAGMQAGHLIAMGDCPETREFYDQTSVMVETNFALGIRFGKVHAEREIAKLQGGLV